MNAPRAAAARPRFEHPAFRYAVVFLLLINFALYAREDWLAAAALPGTGAALFEWTNAFATTLDEAAWFVLLFLFEFELRRLSGGTGRVPFRRLIQVTRALCCLLIAHTVFSNAWDVQSARSAGPAAAPGEIGLAWVGLAESLAWLAVVLLLVLDERALASGRETARAVRDALKVIGYGVLLFAAAYWAAAGHYLYAWDELLWVTAFGGLEFAFRQIRSAAA